jgi:hypothetical protein
MDKMKNIIENLQKDIQKVVGSFIDEKQTILKLNQEKIKKEILEF